jgi:hypothetical protein
LRRIRLFGWNGSDLMSQEPVKRPDGIYEERLGDIWTAEYAEDVETGLWEAVVFKHDVPQWGETGYSTLLDAQRAARAFYDQS